MANTSIPQSRLTPNATVRLVCLPFAGGGSAPFFTWRKVLPSQVDLVPLDLPGHDGRLNEPLFTDLLALASVLADDLQAVLDKPYVLFGYSMGAWLAFELTRELRRRHVRMPALLTVAACPAPNGGPRQSLHKLPDDELVRALEARYDGIPPKVKASPELLQMLLPVLRADMQLGETYRFTEEPQLGTEIFVLGGTEDPAVTPTKLEGWRRHTTGACSVRMLPGGHFFLFRGDQSPALEMIIDRIQQRLEPPDANFNVAES